MELLYYYFPWAVVGLAENRLTMALSSIIMDGESEKSAVERYVLGYLSFWHLASVEQTDESEGLNESLGKRARNKINSYVRSHPPMKSLPEFYLVLVGQHLDCVDADGLSEVYCV
jgi:hypothetical protein